MLNALTIDVEDGWSIFSRDALSKEVDVTQTVVKDTERILGILADGEVKATFFILGNVAVKFPSLIKRIAQSGHELAIHGFSHKQIFRLSKEEFRSEIKQSKDTIENLTSAAVAGYRAPAFSIMPTTKWALRILAEEGFEYDSSVAPCKNLRYGWKDFSKDICLMDLGDGLTIIEVPMTILLFPLTNIAFLTGGGYLRHFPYFVTRAIIKHVEKTRPAIVYTHPYEFGEEEAALLMEHLSPYLRFKKRLLLRSRLRNKSTMPMKIKKLLSDFEFSTMKHVINEWLSHQSSKNRCAKK
ncbi:MAG: DUF3473 domain-containing protein [Sedimentisphaerales bacterium]|nr:DUF3473 domain-containing protein [Sedimentisphaerales bacterium]